MDTIEELKCKLEQAYRDSEKSWYGLGDYDKILRRIDRLRGELAAAEALQRVEDAWGDKV